LEGQDATQRPDLVARVFKLKLMKLMDLLQIHSVFGERRCYMYTIEWQKRGLPHAHILLWLKEKIQPSQIDSCISAEFPDPEQDPDLFNIVQTHMVHGPCGTLNEKSPCMKEIINQNGRKEKVCSKNYPKDFTNATQTDRNGFAMYRRLDPKDGGHVLRKHYLIIDNRWVVPYCPILLLILQTHINVEICSTIEAIKYLCKYINKGTDMATFNLQNTITDEITQFQFGRYICSNEAVWRILGFHIHERHPAIQHLAVHLENGERVYFNPNTVHQLAQVQPKETTLTAFFKLCQEDSFARTLLYCEVPTYYTWNKNEHVWKKRRQGNIVDGYPGVYSSDTLGRVYSVHPHHSECFYLRMLLFEVRGPQSFVNLQMIDGRRCFTYQEACKERGLLEDDAHWNATLEEAKVSESSVMLRNLYALMLHHCNVSSPQILWEKHREDFAQDILHRYRQRYPNIQFNNDIFNEALVLIEDKVLSLGGKKIETYGLPMTLRSRQTPSYELLRECNYDIPKLKKFVQDNENKLTIDQQAAYTYISENIGLYFIDAPGGTGKTFELSLLLAKERMNGRIALAVASSGIAATLLEGGRTAHSVFKLPLNLANTETPTCNISKGTDMAEVLKRCSLIVWDECTMSHKAALEAVDKTLQDIRGNKKVMGGVTFVMAGDFRQTLPIIERGTRANEVQASIKSSKLWNQVKKKFQLSTNMRIHLRRRQNIDDENDAAAENEAAERFSRNLLRLGNGEVCADQNGQIDMKDFGKSVESLNVLITSVFPNITERYESWPKFNYEWLCGRAILAPKKRYCRRYKFETPSTDSNW
ncbi:unnamed protein product, partial [Meganyctiphanes norvegica]